MRQYVAFLHPNDHNGYNIEFPDFGPGIAAASRLDTACILAEASLEAMLGDLVALGCKVPEPRTLTEVSKLRQDPDAIAIMVNAPVPGTDRYAQYACPELLN